VERRVEEADRHRQAAHDPEDLGEIGSLHRQQLCESGAAADVSITASVIERYVAAHARFGEQLTTFARSRGAGLIELDVERDVVGQLESLFATGAYVA